jgi:hypothetical protein
VLQVFSLISDGLSGVLKHRDLDLFQISMVKATKPNLEKNTLCYEITAFTFTTNL